MYQSKTMLHTLLDAVTVISAIAALSFSTTQIASLDQNLQLDVTIQPTRIRVQLGLGSDRKQSSFCDQLILVKSDRNPTA